MRQFTALLTAAALLAAAPSGAQNLAAPLVELPAAAPAPLTAAPVHLAPALQASQAVLPFAPLTLGGLGASQALSPLQRAAWARTMARLAPARGSVAASRKDAAAGVLSLRRLFDAGAAVKAAVSAGSFKGLGILPAGDKPILPGVRLDPRPALASELRVPGVTFQRAFAPTGRRGLFEWLSDAWNGRTPERPLVLPGNPATAAEMEAAVREHIRANPAVYGGVDPAILGTIEVVKVTGRAGLTDAYYVKFKQQTGEDKLEVDGTFLTFTIKAVDGTPAILTTAGQLYPDLNVDTRGRLAPEDLQRRAVERLGMPPEAADQLEAMDRKVMNLGDSWRAVQVFMMKKSPIMVAVDLNTGESFAWDPRWTAQAKDDGTQPAEGTVAGRAMLTDPVEPNTPLTKVPLSDLTVQGRGAKAVTDEKGAFSLNAADGQAVEVAAALSGPYGYVRDQQSPDLKLKQTVTPGQSAELVFNADGTAEGPTAQTTAMYWFHRTLRYVRSLDVWSKDFEKPLPINVEEDDECNAFFDYRSLNFFKQSRRCVDTAMPTVVPHESGHYIHYIKDGHQIKHGGLSEGWGDILSMYLNRTPVLGGGFFKTGERKFIRTGENNYQYSDSDEVHEQGQAWMGFAWKLRVALIAKLGEEAGHALAENLVVPVFNASPTDILSAMQEVVMRDVDAKGNVPHWKELQAAAQAHGIALQKPRTAGGLASRLTMSIVRRLRG